MAGESFTIDVESQSVLQVLERVQAAMRNLTPAFQDIGEYLMRSINERFDKQESPEGDSWQSLLDGTIAQKNIAPGKVLTESSRLRESIVYQASADKLQIGTNVIYGRIHQLGGTILPIHGQFLSFPFGDGFMRVRQVEIPARPYLGLSSDDEKEVLTLIGEFLMEAAGQS